VNDPYADIRPYDDAEVADVLRRLLADRDMLDAVAAFRFGALARTLPFLLRPLVRAYLARQVRGVDSVADLQQVIRHYMDRMIEATTAGFSVSGLDALPGDRAWLFISNHRDIAMDPAFTNYALHSQGRDTVRIAIGDNLLTTPWVSDLMRLNKSFIVRRSASGPRELLARSRQLSDYIRFSLQEQCAPIWIAQREGRAKDGIDRTEPAVIKMLTLARDKASETFSDYVARLNIVPVAISYELDPCDARKANEVWQRRAHGDYEKGAQEDVDSIGLGISGSKGRVHVSFGTPLGEGFETPAQVAGEIDRQIVSAYCLHPTNLLAYRLLGGDVARTAGLQQEAGAVSERAFRARIEAIPEAQREDALAIYANAVRSKLALRESGSLDGAE
jgi:hypothetical protein